MVPDETPVAPRRLSKSEPGTARATHYGLSTKE